MSTAIRLAANWFLDLSNAIDADMPTRFETMDGHRTALHNKVDNTLTVWEDDVKIAHNDVDPKITRDEIWFVIKNVKNLNS